MSISRNRKVFKRYLLSIQTRYSFFSLSFVKSVNSIDREAGEAFISFGRYGYGKDHYHDL